MQKFVLFIFSFTLLICLALGLFVSIKESKKLAGLEVQTLSETEARATLGENSYTILFVDKEQIKPFFGLAKNEFGVKMALVREDLPDDVKEFVAKHEVYHLQDTEHQGFFSREINANLSGAHYEPLGFLKTTWLTLTSIERIKYYLSRL